MQGFIEGIVNGCLIQFLVWLLLLPISLLITTPVILVLALFGKESYGKNLNHYYQKVIAFWLNMAGYA